MATDREADHVGHLGPDPLREDWDAGEALAFLTGVSPWTPVGEVDVARPVERARDDAATLGEGRGRLPG